MKALDRRRFCAALATLSAAPLFAGEAFGQTQSATATPTKASPVPAAKPGSYPSVIGQLQRHVTRYEDSLVDLARAYNLGYTEMVAANPGIDPWVPGADVEVVIPTLHIVPDGAREGLLLNLSDQRLYWFRPDGKTVSSVPVGVGDQGWKTPKGSTKIVRKQANPSWYVPKSVLEEDPTLPKVVRPGPDNPLGTHAFYLGWPAYLIHGTNKPFGVGRRVSHGCVRLYPEDIARLFPQIPVGTPVTVIDQELKVARMAGQLWVEIHPSQAQAVELEQEGEFAPAKPPEFEFRILQAAGGDAKLIDWEKAKSAAVERRGVPVPILKTTVAATSNG